MAKRKKPKAEAEAKPPAVAADTAGQSTSGADEPAIPPQDNPKDAMFTPQTLDRTIIALPLLKKMGAAKAGELFDIIIDVNLEYEGGRRQARYDLWEWIDQLPEVRSSHPDKLEEGAASVALPLGEQGIDASKSQYSQQYLFGRLSAENIKSLVKRSDQEKKQKSSKDKPAKSALYRIWQDDEISVLTNLSVSTVKADAARNSFGTSGRNILWAVVDTGIDKTHPHFQKHKNLDLNDPLIHRDFTGSGTPLSACIDEKGHGTHVAGIIAGEYRAQDAQPIVATVRRRDENDAIVSETVTDIPQMSGMAPECKLLSLKVLGSNGKGNASNLIAALEYVQELNGGGRRIRVHGVNMSVGYNFEPEWFACGQSPLCVEVDRLVRSGVVVVVAAGNTGYGFNQVGNKSVAAGQDVTINDPGNAELAITVGSTHREMPHIYGVSYFSSKGPTGDGRLKPDMVAPGEKIISCQSSNMGMAAGTSNAAPAGAAGAPQVGPAANYKEDSGTSMAAPHVSGVIAAFLSVRREFIGNPEAVKNIFMSTATDLKRAVYFQGKGLVDLMRAIQSV